jgi:hypothetical protein
MKRRLWRALIPERVRREVLDRVQALIARRADPLEAKVDACLVEQAAVLARLQGFEGRLSALETRLAAVSASSDHAERVAIPSLSARARALEQKVERFETVEAPVLHKRCVDLRHDFDVLSADARSMFEYWEMRTDKIYASLLSRLPELARSDDEK